jgi:hypothetical protein
MVPQFFFECITCGFVGKKVCCQSCINQCHVGHNFKFYSNLESKQPGYCDCGTESSCKCSKIAPTIKVKEQFQVISQEHSPEVFTSPLNNSTTKFSQSPKKQSFGSSSYGSLNLKELKNLCKERSIKGFSSLNKEDLIQSKFKISKSKNWNLINNVRNA